MFNVKVKTPIGEGMSRGHYLVVERDTHKVLEQCMLVRIDVTDKIRPYLAQSCCVTPRAIKSALFFFPLSQVTT